ncbi:hypothetical protein POM88_046625 [Heracleum sosnowskyi]|uniref:MLO-like protein n=1 Tax=Heracleum sosnowskyi TaxID=360622 RepID=A0AAD8H856_9APIA|nr:hypothetical protein POM88_046625 [Heracleum sosnowskyi]
MAKIVDEAEEEVNVDAWLSEDAPVDLEAALRDIRQDYLTSIESIPKDITPAQVFSVMNKHHKFHIRSLHQVSKGFLQALESHQEIVKGGMLTAHTELFKKFLIISNLNTQNNANTRKFLALDTEVSLLKTRQKEFTESIERLLKFNTDVPAMIKCLYKNAYGDKIYTTVSIREMATPDYEVLIKKAREAFELKHFRILPLVTSSSTSTSINLEISALQHELADLKFANQELATTVKLMGEQQDQNSKDLNATVQAIQAQLALLVSSSAEPDNNPKGGRKVTRRTTRTSTSKKFKAEECEKKKDVDTVVEQVIAEEDKETEDTDNVPLLRLKSKGKELMMLGFISLLLTVFQGTIAKLCVPESLIEHLIPCPLSGKPSEEKASHSEPETTSHFRRLLEESAKEDLNCSSRPCILAFSLMIMVALS